MLTPKQAKFVAEYVVDLNATQAAIRAGYSVTRAAVTASELMKQPAVADAIAVRNRNVTERVEKTASDISRAAWAIIENGDEPASARVAALNLEAKRFSDYSDKHEITGDVRLRVEAMQAVALMTPEQMLAIAEAARGQR